MPLTRKAVFDFKTLKFALKLKTGFNLHIARKFSGRKYVFHVAAIEL